MSDDLRAAPPALERDLVELCALVSEAIDSSTEALIQGRPHRAEAVVRGHKRVAAVANRCEQRALGLLTNTDRTAESVRRIVTALEAVADLRRMAVLAERIADIAARSSAERGVPEEVEGHVAEMGRTCATLTDLARAILSSDFPQCARGLPADYDAMDRLHQHLLTVLLDREWRHGVPSAVEAAMIGRHYDRYGEHAARVVRAAEELAGREPACGDRGGPVPEAAVGSGDAATAPSDPYPPQP